MHGEYRRFYQQPRYHETEANINHRAIGQFRQARGQIGHVQRAGHSIGKPNTDDIEGRAYRPNNEIVIGRNQGTPDPPCPHGNQDHRTQG